MTLVIPTFQDIDEMVAASPFEVGDPAAGLTVTVEVLPDDDATTVADELYGDLTPLQPYNTKGFYVDCALGVVVDGSTVERKVSPATVKKWWMGWVYDRPGRNKKETADRIGCRGCGEDLQIAVEGYGYDGRNDPDLVVYVLDYDKADWVLEGIQADHKGADVVLRRIYRGPDTHAYRSSYVLNRYIDTRRHEKGERDSDGHPVPYAALAERCHEDAIKRITLDEGWDVKAIKVTLFVDGVEMLAQWASGIADFNDSESKATLLAAATDTIKEAVYTYEQDYQQYADI